MTIVEDAVRDFRHAIRTLAKAPLLSAVVVLSLALGVGVNTVVFSWIQARLLDPVPGVAGGARITLVEPRNDAGLYTGASWLEYQDLRSSLRSVPDLFASRMVPLYVGRAPQVERVFGLLVSDNYFSALGVEPALGRFFTADEVARPGGPPVAVISDGLWRGRSGGAAEAAGGTLRVNGIDLTVIGVTPPEFQGTVVGLNFDIWVPATLAPIVAGGSRELEERGFRGYALMGRLAPGVSRPQAQDELTAVMRRLAQAHPATNGTMTAEVLSFADSPRGPQRMLNAALLALQGLMLLLLAAVCGNVANLMLARAASRGGEMAARLALGARRRHIVRILLAENLVLALVGAAFGGALAIWGTRALLVLPLTGLPLRFETRIDGAGLAFAMTLGLACGLAAGLVPALQLARLPTASVLRAGAASPPRMWIHNAVMGSQVALALIVLVVAGLFLRGFIEARTTDPGFERDRVLLAAYDLAGRRTNLEFARDLAARTIERLRALPGVEGAAIASSVPLDIHGMPSRAFTVEGHARTDGYDEALANVVTPGYFAVMGIPLEAGGDFADLRDRVAAPQAVVNREFVRRYVGSGEPLGRRLQARGTTYVIAGVAADSTYDAFGEPATPMIYFSYRDVPQPRGEIHLRTRAPAAAALAIDLRRAMQAVDGDLPVFNVRPMTDHVETNLIFRRVPARMFAVLGPMLLALAAIGIYAVVSYSVSVRTHEVGIRMALGAPAGRVVREIVEAPLLVVALGAAAGWLVAFVAAIGALGDAPIDVAVFGGVPAILLLAAAAACWLPAWRATRGAPMLALRHGSP